MKKEYGSFYFDRQGKELELMDWAKRVKDEQYRRIGEDQLKEYLVSTVWVGLNMNLCRNPALIFETMIFCKNENDDLYLYQDRYSTEEQAIEGHAKAVSLVKDKLDKELK